MTPQHTPPHAPLHTSPLTPHEIARKIQQQFPDAVTASLPGDKHPRIHTTAAHWHAMAHWLRHEPSLSFDWLGCLTAVDYVADNQLCVVYELRSTTWNHWFAIKVYMDRDTPDIPSVTDLWPGANWHEREAFDLMGIIFQGHPDLRRILLPEDWEGHPLRKDYVYPREYHGIPGSTELDWQQKPDYPR